MPGAELADVARPDEEAMRRHLGVGRVVAEGREEELGQAHPRRIAGAAPRTRQARPVTRLGPCRSADRRRRAPASGPRRRRGPARVRGGVGAVAARGRGTPRARTTTASAATARDRREVARGRRSTSRANAGSPQGPASRGRSRRLRRRTEGIQRQRPMRRRRGPRTPPDGRPISIGATVVDGCGRGHQRGLIGRVGIDATMRRVTPRIAASSRTHDVRSHRPPPRRRVERPPILDV